MIGIGSIGLSQTITSSTAKSLEKKKAPEMFTFTPSYEEAKERAEQKKENSERWTSNPLFKTDLNSALGYTTNKDAIEKVREKLKEEGFDPLKHTPAHEITDEQMAQLAEKYDLEFLNMAGMENPEYGNFLLDLAYMNVFSCDELECNFAGIGVPVGVLYCIETYDGSKAGYYIWNDQHFKSYDDVVKAYRMDYIRTQDPGRSENYYQAKYEDITAKTQERMNVLKDFFDRASKYSYPGLADVPKPAIEDASGKLKEDFGKLLA